MRSITVSDGKYKIYEDGNVFRVRDGKEEPLSLNYPNYLMLYVGHHRYVPVHRLVAKAFVPNPDNLPYVNHIDGNKHNNAASNLEWVSKRDNVMLAYCLGLRKNKNYIAYKERYEAIIRERYGKSIAEVLGGGSP